MNRQVHTRQQLDPIGTVGNALATVMTTASAFVFAVVMTGNVIDTVTRPALAIVALLLLGAGCVLLLHAASPYRAPFTRRTHHIVVISGLTAIACQAGAEWYDDQMVRSGWCAIPLGLLYLAMGPYRPAQELALSGTVSSLIAGAIALLHLHTANDDVPALALIAVTVLPILALSYASATYSGAVVNALVSWRESLQTARKEVTRDETDGVARSVQQDRITLLNREVVPFFSSVVERGELTEGDRQHARSIADSVRRLMVSEVDRSWLEQVLEQLMFASTAGPQRSLIHDDEHIAHHMTDDQRTALRAFLVALREEHRPEAGFLQIDLFSEAASCRGVLVAKLALTEMTLRSRFAPYFAVLRVIFADLRIEYFHGVLTLSFSYEQR